VTRDGRHNEVFARLRPDVVAKPDGRYLIYYSLERDEPDRTGEAPAQRPPTPAQQPWSPETGPADDAPGNEDV
jgi:hypothetical protein